MENEKWKMGFPARRLLLIAYFLADRVRPNACAAQQRRTHAAPQSNDLQSLITRQASLVTEFEVNGLKVLFKRREGGQSVAAGLFIKGGSRNITASNAGVENLMLQVATEASAGYPRERLRSELARTGTVITSSDNYDYSVLSMTSTRTNFDSMWTVFTDIALRPAFTKEDFDLAKTRALASLADDSDDPDTYLQRLQEHTAYAGHPYVNRPEGTVESVSRLTLEDIRRYHQQVMETSRLLLVVVGDLNVNQLRQQITNSFGKLPRGSYRADSVPQLSFSSPSVNVTERSLPTNYVQGLFAAPPLTSPDIYPMEIASAMLRDRVFEEVRVKRSRAVDPRRRRRGRRAAEPDPLSLRLQAGDGAGAVRIPQRAAARSAERAVRRHVAEAVRAMGPGVRLSR